MAFFHGLGALGRPTIDRSRSSTFMKFTRTITITKIERKIVTAGTVSRLTNASPETPGEAALPAPEEAPQNANPLPATGEVDCTEDK